MSGVLQLLFGSTDVTALLYAGSVTFSKPTNQRWSCSFTLIDLTGTNRQTVGQPFTLKEDGAVRFTGFIDEIEEQPYEGSLVKNQYHCKCSSWASVCDHRVVTKVYGTGASANSVILDIVANFLNAESITTVHVNCPGSITAPLALQPVTVAQAFDTIRDMCDGQWWVDENRDLHFSQVGSGSALGFSITDTTTNQDWLAGSARVSRTTKDFRNVQYVASSSSLATSTTCETTIISNSLQFFIPTKEPITGTPTVTIDGVSQTVVQWTDATGAIVTPFGQAAWYWGVNMAGVQQGQQIAPPVGSNVVVCYPGADPAQNYVVESDSASVTARAAIEGTSGKWEQVTQIPKIDDPSVAQALAQGLLTRSDVIPVQVQLDTYRSDFVIGSKLTVNLTQHGVNATLTVQQIQAKEVAFMQGPVSGQTFKYTVLMTNAQDIGNYVKWMEGLVRAIGAAATSAAAGTVAPPVLNQAPIATANVGVIRQVPAGTLDGSNRIFTLKYSPAPQWGIILTKNGVYQRALIGGDGVDSVPADFGSGSITSERDFVLSANTITYRVAPESTDVHECVYFQGIASDGVQFPIYSTGLDNSFAALATSSVDPHWTLTASADLSFPGPNLYVPAAQLWPTADLAQWICPETNPTTTDNAVGDYTYSTSFDLTGFNHATARLSLNVMVDDTATVKLNGATIGTASGYGGAFASISAAAGFVSGVNTLTVIVHNNSAGHPNPCGLLVVVTSATATP